MMVSRSRIRIYEVLTANKENVIMIKDRRTMVVITEEEFNLDEWWTTTLRRERKKRGKAKGTS